MIAQPKTNALSDVVDPDITLHFELLSGEGFCTCRFETSSSVRDLYLHLEQHLPCTERVRFADAQLVNATTRSNVTLTELGLSDGAIVQVVKAKDSRSAVEKIWDGATFTDLMAQGLQKFDGEQAKIAGVSQSELRSFSAKELKNIGFSIASLRELGFSAKELNVAGFSLHELRRAGFGGHDLKAGGISASALEEVGFFG